jgi:hypothetical protein
MDHIGISLGWNCYSAAWGVANNIREKKINGYKTCPFDECFTNYNGVIECINDNFKYFLDINYLKLIKAQFTIESIKEEELLIINTKYNFIFNHESPGHANLYLTEKWLGGINHFIDNNFKEFINRYIKRINNFREYMNNNLEIIFILTRYNQNTIKLEEIIKKQYPKKKFNIIKLIPEFNIDIIQKHYKLCNINEKYIQNDC